MYKVVRTSRLYEQIVQQIEDSVLKGTLKPGDQLPAERDLAQRLGVSRQTVNAIETERYDPSLPLAFKLARLFKLPIEEIFEPEKE